MHLKCVWTARSSWRSTLLSEQHCSSLHVDTRFLPSAHSLVLQHTTTSSKGGTVPVYLAFLTSKSDKGREEREAHFLVTMSKHKILIFLFLLQVNPKWISIFESSRFVEKNWSDIFTHTHTYTHTHTHVIFFCLVFLLPSHNKSVTSYAACAWLSSVFKELT